jgi:hypothetical protein
MRYIEVPGEINQNNQLILHESLTEIKPQRVKIEIIFRDPDEEDYREPTKAEILESIRQGFRECLRGETSPISELWDDTEIEATGEINEQGQLVLDEPLKEINPQYVDVVMWFIKDEEYLKKFYGSKENIYEEYPTLVKELSGSIT